MAGYRFRAPSVKASWPRAARESRENRDSFHGDFAAKRGRRVSILGAMDHGASRFRIAVHRFRGGYFANALDLPGCVARGATEVEAIENARAAIRAYRLVAGVLAAERATVVLEISA